MSLNTVTLKWDLTDLIQAGIAATLSITPTAQLSDTTDHLLIPPVARTCKFTGGTGQLAGIIANDNANILPAYNPPSQPGAGYLISVTTQAGVVIVPQFQTQLLFSNGATQWLDALAVVPSVATSYQFLPVPSGTPSSGQVPAATGTGEASAWTTLTAASVGAWGTAAALRDNGGSYYDVRQFGAKCDGISGYTGQATSGSPTFTDPAASFTSALTGKVFTMRTTGGIWTGTVSAVPSSTTLTISANAPANSQTSGTHGAMTSGSNLLTDTNVTFAQNLMGAIVTVQGAGAGGIALTGQLLTPTVAGTAVYLVATGDQSTPVNAGTTVSSASYTVNLGMYTIGTDDGAAWASAVTAASSAAASGLSPVIRWNGVSMVSSMPIIPGGVTLQGGGSDPDQPAIAWAVNGSVIRAHGNFSGSTTLLRLGGTSANYQETNLGAQLIDCTIDAAQVTAYAVKTSGNLPQIHRCTMRNGTTAAVYLNGWQTQIHASTIEQPGYGTALLVGESDAQITGGFVKSAQYMVQAVTGGNDLQAIGVHMWNSYPPPSGQVNANVYIGTATATRMSFTGCYFDNVYGPQVKIAPASGVFVGEVEFVGCKFFQNSTGTGGTGWFAYPDNTYPVLQLDTSASSGQSISQVLLSGCSGGGVSSTGRYSALVTYAGTSADFGALTYDGVIINNCAAIYTGSTPAAASMGNVKVYDSGTDNSGPIWRSVPWPPGNNNPQTATANGSTTAFTVNHNLNGTPKRVSVIPENALAAAPFYVTAAVDTLTITYLTAPSSGTLGWWVSLEL